MSVKIKWYVPQKDAPDAEHEMHCGSILEARTFCADIARAAVLDGNTLHVQYNDDKSLPVIMAVGKTVYNMVVVH